MNHQSTLHIVVGIVASIAFADVAVAQRQMESLTRGVTVVPTDQGDDLVSTHIIGWTFAINLLWLTLHSQPCRSSQGRFHSVESDYEFQFGARL